AFGSALAVGVTTFFLLVFGEIVPKTYGREHAVTISQRIIGFLDLIYKFLRPLIGLFVFISNLFIRLTGSPKIKEVPLLTEDDVRTLIELGEREGVLEEEEREMIHSIIVNDFAGFAAHLAEEFEPPEGRGTEEWVNAQWKLYKGIDPAAMSFTWGVNGFELKRDGTIECRFFLEISDGGKKRIIQQQESWILESAAWKLVRVM
ncbi:MAG TPA: DUF21 domain-containing protein, partial [Spirochaetota bacterium]|nr:DUF21 domain-containing protein [Spirochaetota bacterium]